MSGRGVVTLSGHLHFLAAGGGILAVGGWLLLAKAPKNISSCLPEW